MKTACTFKIKELQKGAKHPFCNLDFINKIVGRSNGKAVLDIPSILFIKSKLQGE